MSQASSQPMALDVLGRLIDIAVRAVPGVVRLAPVPPGKAHSATTITGIVLHTSHAGVAIDCYVVAALGASLPTLGMALQATIAAVLQRMAHVEACEVNIYIQDVEAARG